MQARRVERKLQLSLVGGTSAHLAQDIKTDNEPINKTTASLTKCVFQQHLIDIQGKLCTLPIMHLRFRVVLSSNKWFQKGRARPGPRAQPLTQEVILEYTLCSSVGAQLKALDVLRVGLLSRWLYRAPRNCRGDSNSNKGVSGTPAQRVLGGRGEGSGMALPLQNQGCLLPSDGSWEVFHMALTRKATHLILLLLYFIFIFLFINNFNSQKSCKII